MRPIIEQLLEFAQKFNVQDLTPRTQHIETTLMVKSTVLDLMTAKAPVLQKLMDGFGAKLDLRVVKHVDDALIEMLRTIDQELQKEAEESKGLENPENVVETKEKSKLQSSFVTAFSMAIKSRAEIEMNLKYPYVEEFKNNLLSSFSPDIQQILQMTLSDLIPNSQLLKKMMKGFDQQEFDIKSLAENLVDKLEDLLKDNPAADFIRNLHEAIV